MAQQFIIVFPPQLNNLPEIKSNTQFIGYDPDTGKLVRISATVVYGNEGYPEWNSGGSYDEDEIVIYQLRFWKSLEDDNEGNIPSENSHWTEVSASEIPTTDTDHWRGSYDLSTEAYPSSGGTGASGVPAPGDDWYGINSGDFDVEGMGLTTLYRGARLTYIGGLVTSPSSWIVKQ
jgi:hypothetical protein